MEVPSREAYLWLNLPPEKFNVDISQVWNKFNKQPVLSGR